MPHPRKLALPSLAALLSFLSFPFTAFAQPTSPALVRDINPGVNREERSGEPQIFIEKDGIVYFHNFDPAYGEEVWQTDGTEEGTFLFKDFAPGPDSSSAGGSTFVVGDSLYFFGFDGDQRFVLWKSDGTPAGTVPFLPGLEGAFLLSVVGDNLYLFRGCRETGPCELWKSDGTEVGTVKVADLTPPPGSFGISGIGKFDGPLFFFKFYSQDDTLQELWRSDGTAAGTFPLRRFTGVHGLVSGGVQIGGTFFFNGLNGLWKSDGTVAGTVPLKDVAPVDLRNFGGTLYFSGRDDASGGELWKSDGTEAGTVLIKDIAPGPESSYASALGRIHTGEILVLVWRPVTGFELWKTDGTEAGTVLVKDIVPGPDDSIDGLTFVNGRLFFLISDGVHGTELWTSDGTAEGTRLVKDIVPGPGSPSIVAPGGAAGKLFFWADDGVHGEELWTSDGTEAGTVPVKDLVQATSSTPALLTVSGDHLFFAANDGSQGNELWKTDGTEAGTVLAHDFSPGFGSSYFSILVDIDGTLYLDVNGETWKTDGTPGGLVSIPSLNARSLVKVGSRLFFESYSPATGSELYTADGGLVKDIRPGAQGSGISEMKAMNGLLFFRADDGSGPGLWRSDGTAAGTFEIAAVRVRQLTGAGDALFFTVFDEASWTWSLWKSDGTSGGTSEIETWSAGNLPHDLTAMGVTLFFGLSPGTGGEELWKSDSNGTVRVARVSDVSSPIAEVTPMDGLLFFTAADASGRELWRSDGTEAGTFRVADIYPGPEGSHPASLTLAGNGRLAFAATDPAHGREVWMSDGSPEGTFLVGDVAPGTRSSWPEELTLWNGRVYFSADDGTTGVELWSFGIEHASDSSSVTGAGWIVLPQGKAIFQVVAGHGKSGKAQLKAPGVDFRARSFLRLSVNGPTAWLRGGGTFNGQQGYTYWIALTDGQAPGGDGLDRARIQIVGPGNIVVFDNEPGKPVNARPTTVLGGGSIKLQTKTQ